MHRNKGFIDFRADQRRPPGPGRNDVFSRQSESPGKPDVPSNLSEAMQRAARMRDRIENRYERNHSQNRGRSRDRRMRRGRSRSTSRTRSRSSVNGRSPHRERSRSFSRGRSRSFHRRSNSRSPLRRPSSRTFNSRSRSRGRGERMRSISRSRNYDRNIPPAEPAYPHRARTPERYRRNGRVSRFDPPAASHRSPSRSRPGPRLSSIVTPDRDSNSVGYDNQFTAGALSRFEAPPSPKRDSLSPTALEPSNGVGDLYEGLVNEASRGDSSASFLAASFLPQRSPRADPPGLTRLDGSPVNSIFPDVPAELPVKDSLPERSIDSQGRPTVDDRYREILELREALRAAQSRLESTSRTTQNVPTYTPENFQRSPPCREAPVSYASPAHNSYSRWPEQESQLYRTHDLRHSLNDRLKVHHTHRERSFDRYDSEPRVTDFYSRRSRSPYSRRSRSPFERHHEWPEKPSTGYYDNRPRVYAESGEPMRNEADLRTTFNLGKLNGEQQNNVISNVPMDLIRKLSSELATDVLRNAPSYSNQKRTDYFGNTASTSVAPQQHLASYNVPPTQYEHHEVSRATIPERSKLPPYTADESSRLQPPKPEPTDNHIYTDMDLDDNANEALSQISEPQVTKPEEKYADEIINYLRLTRDKDAEKERLGILKSEMSRISKLQADLMCLRRKFPDDPMLGRQLGNTGKLYEEAKKRAQNVHSRSEALSQEIFKIPQKIKLLSMEHEAKFKTKLAAEQGCRIQTSDANKKQLEIKYIDRGNYFCSFCKCDLRSIVSCLNHMHTPMHSQNSKQKQERPWAVTDSVSKQTAIPVVATNFSKVPAKGAQFMIGVTGFFCKLCKIMFPDSILAEEHVLSEAHNLKYKDFIAMNPFYERRIELEKEALVHSTANATAPRKDLVTTRNQTGTDKLLSSTRTPEISTKDKPSPSSPQPKQAETPTTRRNITMCPSQKSPGIRLKLLPTSSGKPLVVGKAFTRKTSIESQESSPSTEREPLSNGPPGLPDGTTTSSRITTVREEDLEEF